MRDRRYKRRQGGDTAEAQIRQEINRPQNRRHCADCGRDFWLLSLDVCDSCKILLCTSCMEAHDCDSWRIAQQRGS